jgi:nucleotide-binding universal stress UspA family protein
MCDVILTLLERYEAAAATLSAAATLAGMMSEAHINVLAIRVPPEATIMPTEELLTTRTIARMRAAEAERVVALRSAYDTWAPSLQGATVTIEWADVEGVVEALVTEWGRPADLIVLGRSGSPVPLADRGMSHTALFETDRPVLIVPPGAPVTFGRRVAIAWRDDAHAVRAVLAALRLLTGATEVHVLAGTREGRPPPRLPEILAEHGIAAQLHIMPIGAGVFGEALLTRARDLGCDLFVMGAYAHSPWRELILGGVTRHVLAHADLPVLLRH